MCTRQVGEAGEPFTALLLHWVTKLCSFTIKIIVPDQLINNDLQINCLEEPKKIPNQLILEPFNHHAAKLVTN